MDNRFVWMKPGAIAARAIICGSVAVAARANARVAAGVGKNPGIDAGRLLAPSAILARSLAQT